MPVSLTSDPTNRAARRADAAVSAMKARIHRAQAVDRSDGLPDSHPISLMDCQIHRAGVRCRIPMDCQIHRAGVRCRIPVDCRIHRTGEADGRGEAGWLRASRNRDPIGPHPPRSRPAVTCLYPLDTRIAADQRRPKMIMRFAKPSQPRTGRHRLAGGR